MALRSIYGFYNRYDPDFTWWVPHPYHKTDSLLTAYTSFLHQKSREAAPVKDNSGIAGVAAGRTELLRQLQYEMIPYTPEELIDLANKEFAWCDRELLKAAREMGFGDNWKAAQEKVKKQLRAPRSAARTDSAALRRVDCLSEGQKFGHHSARCRGDLAHEHDVAGTSVGGPVFSGGRRTAHLVPHRRHGPAR